MSTSHHARLRRVLTVLSLAAFGLVVGAGVAAAHVEVSPSEAAAGSDATLSFHVPNESAKASTVRVTVRLPTDHPFASVTVRAIPGWTVTPTRTALPAPVKEGDFTIKEAVTSVTWTATSGSAIGPGQFAEFDIDAGPVPDVPELAFPTEQTYSDGTVVQWNEPTPASGDEPEHPVPTLTVTAAASEGHDHSGVASSSASASIESSTATGSSSEPSTATASAADAGIPATAAAASTPPTVTAAATTTDNSTATVLAAVSIVIAAAALLVAVVALRRRTTGTTEGREQ